MVASRQATELDKEKIRLDTEVHTMEKELSKRAGEKMELEGKVNRLEFKLKELKILAEDLKTDIVEKETCLDHLQKKSNELSSSMSKAKDEVVKQFKSFSAYTKLLDETYAAGFEEFHIDAHEAFPGVDFDSIKLPLAGESSLLPSTFEDVDIDDDATTSDKPKDDVQPMDVAQSKDDALTGLSQQFLSFIMSIFFLFFVWGPLFWTIFNLLKYIHFVYGFGRKFYTFALNFQGFLDNGCLPLL